MYQDVIVRVRRVQRLPERGDTKLAVVRTPLVRPGLPLYHVGMVVEESGRTVVLEHGPIRAATDPDTILGPAEYWTLPGVDIPLEHIVEYHHSLPKWYVLGVRDCRHHVLDLLDYCFRS